MQIKKIPITSYDEYISGWESLNIPAENGDVADWHPQNFFYSNKKDEVKLYKKNNILNNIGIEKRKIYYPEEKIVYISNFPRAIVDILLNCEDYMLNELNGIKDNLTDKQKKELFDYLLKTKNNSRISNFLKYEYGYLGDEDDKVAKK